jgi:1-phosphatidylinositol-3-phosphate 5-kinase
VDKQDEESLMRRPTRLPKTRLPKRPAQQPSVADLVKKYSDILSAEGVRDLAKTALAPPMPISESEADYPAPLIRNQGRSNRNRHHQLSQYQQTSDIDQGYSASVNSRQPGMRTRRIASTTGQSSRIPGPTLSPQPTSQLNSQQFAPPGSPTPSGRFPAAPNAANRLGKGKSNFRVPSRGEKAVRPTQMAGPKSTFRRPPGMPGSKVSNIAKQFERINKDNERANRRYSVLHGRRARPVASARTKVEILDSVKDAIRDESDSDDPSSEADDEGEGEEEANKNENASAPTSLESSFEGSKSLPNPQPEQKPPEETAPSTNETSKTNGSTETSQVVQVDKREDDSSLPPTPLIPSSERESSSNSQILEVESSAGTERNSILKALTGFWHPPPRQRLDLEHDDAGGDPEHLFRDSSIAVRTDEPTSIIAMALRLATFIPSLNSY